MITQFLFGKRHLTHLGIELTLRRFGEVLGAGELAQLAFKLYDAALAPSSKKSYSSGEKHFVKFTSKYKKIAKIYSLPHPAPPAESLALCLFAASLFLTKSIKSSATIKSYIRHAKNYCIKRGCDPVRLESHVLKRILIGISKRRPVPFDARPAFLLPHYQFPLRFRYPTTLNDCVLMAALISGFFGMLRFHVFRKLKLNSLVLVGGDGREYKMAGYSSVGHKHLIFSEKIIGFYFDVNDKCHPTSRVYLPKLVDMNPFWEAICPFRALRRMWVHGLLISDPFSKENLSIKGLINAMKIIDKNERNFKSHSLRIGAHTFFITYGLPEDFVNFLGSRTVAKSSQRYYRASARLTISKFRHFAKNVTKL